LQDSASKSSDDSLCELEEKLQNMSTADNISICANCGKEGANNICNKCQSVKYCNAACKKKHRHKHKKDCEEYVRLAAEHNAKLHDEKLFKQPPKVHEDCPICFVRMPTLTSGWRYKACCGKVICSGCIHAPVYDDQGNEVDIIKQNECPFCRTVAPNSDNELNSMLIKRSEAGDAIAIYNLGVYYDRGMYGLSQDFTKAVELFHHAAELGYFKAYNGIGCAYQYGRGVEIDKKKAMHYYELSVMGGIVEARHNLGVYECNAGNMGRALKHFMVAVRDGKSESLEKIKGLYTKGHATKEDYTIALRLYQEYLGDIKSAQRDEAAAADESYQYY